MFDTYTIVYLLTNLFEAVVLHRFMLAFFECRRSNPWICLFSYGLFYSVSSLVYLSFDIPLLTLLTSWGLIFIITLNYDANMPRRVLISLYILFFCMIPEIVLGVCVGYFHYSIFQEGAFCDSLGLIAMRLMTYVEALIFYHIKAVRRRQKVKGSVWAASVLIPVSTFVLFWIILSGDTTQTKMLVAVGIIYFVNIVVFYLYDSLAASYIKIAESAILQKERELYLNQCHLMQNSTEELRSFRHDLKNQLIVALDLMEKEQYGEAQNLLEILAGKIQAKAIYSQTGNMPIDSLINYKLQTAENEFIRVETEIAIPKDLEIEASDSIIILGNLLDNALEALKSVEKEERFLNIKMVYDKECLILRMENSYGTDICEENGKIISTKACPQKHGYGLKNVEKAVEKYDGYMELHHENGIFTVEVMVFVPIYCKK